MFPTKLSATLLRPSVIGGLVALRSYLNDNPGHDVGDAAKALSVSYTYSGFDFNNALLLHPLIPDLPTSIESSFQVVISHIIAEANPPWIGLLKSGRERLSRGISLDVRACFERAGAFSPTPSIDTVRWLDRIIARSYSEAEANRLFAGRDAERRSFELEIQRLGESHTKTVEWASLNDNSLGYDIRSHQPGAPDIPKYIEVKSSRYNPAIIYITQNEWLAAVRLKPHYFFHIWCTEHNLFREVHGEEMAVHIPENRGSGEWQNVALTLRIQGE